MPMEMISVARRFMFALALCFHLDGKFPEFTRELPISISIHSIKLSYGYEMIFLFSCRFHLVRQFQRAKRKNLSETLKKLFAVSCKIIYTHNTHTELLCAFFSTLNHSLSLFLSLSIKKDDMK